MERCRKFFRRLETNLELHLKRNKIKTRTNCGNGLWVGFLLPACLIICISKYSTSNVFQLTGICSIGLSIGAASFIFFAGITSNNVKIWNDTLFPGLVTTILCITKMNYGILPSFAIGSLSSVGFKYCLLTILRNCPLSFSVGEALLVSQAIVLFICSSFVDIYLSFYITPILDHDIITNILEAGIFAVFLVIVTLFEMRSNMNLKKFFITISMYLTLMLIILQITLNRSPLLWMILYIFTDFKKIIMIFYWATVSGFAVMAIATQTSLGSKATTARRKIFHLMIVAVYIPGLMFECDLIYLASGIALAAQIALETVRKLNLGRFSAILDDGFYVFADEKDVGGISLTPIYLLLGIAMPLFIHPLPCNSNRNIIILLSGILSVGIGDTAASYFGNRYGKHKWPNTSKSLEGTLASLLLQIFTVYFTYKIGFVEYEIVSAIIIFVAILINCIVEAFTDQVDNLTLPLITYGILTFGLKP